MGTNITGIGNANAIGFKSRVTGGAYFPPELKDALVGVWSAYGKSNDSTDRNIIKNKIKDRGGDFVISNAAFKLNSGFGKYETELSNTRIWTQSKETTSSPFSSNYNGLSGWIVFANTELTNSVDMPSFKIQVKGLLEGQELIYRYYDSTGQTNVYSMTKDGKYTLPADVRTAKPLTSNTSGFQIVKNETNTITITQIPSFEGAFVTDGIDDLITSTKTVQEMGITDEITVVSMIHKISSDNNWTNLIGELKEDHTFVANRATNTDKTGIYGYTYNYVGDAIVINNILGDKNDYIVRTSTSLGLDNKYYVTGFENAGSITGISQIAWYWTFIANKVLTTDQINQVIAYYNLDRTLNPDILCNVKKQRITNENHAEFGDKLIDYSGNGRDIQLNNIAWNKESGIDDNGALRLDGVNDFGKVTGMPIYKDYTVVVNKDRISTDASCVLSKAATGTNVGAFITEFRTSTYSFGLINAFSTQMVGISYQSKYIYNGERELTTGSNVDTDTMWLGTIRDNDSRFFNGAIYSLMSFPYSMSEFLIERQLKKHKLGTLYPDMVEFRPVIKTNVDYTLIQFYINNYTKRIYPGDYIPINTPIEVNFYLKNNVDELISFKVNGNDSTFKRSTVVDNAYNIRTLPITKSPQKINITIDEYIRYEDIVQPYPVLLRFNDENGNEVSWGGKFRVGSTITIIGSAADSNLLPNIYNIFGLLLNDNQVTSSKVIVEKTMVFKAKSAYIFDNNEPKCILSPRLLRIPNSSYKILGYIPDISGHGNHGVIHNSAYAEGSGVNEDGSYQFDGVDDFVTIPTLPSGGKQVLMKVNWQSNTGDAILYDQRFNVYNYEFAIYNSNTDNYSENPHAYSSRNNGKTYIDGILNTYIKSAELQNVTHNIIATNELSSGSIPLSPIIGSNISHDSAFAQMSLYDFVLFDEISTDDKIKELNDYVGVEPKVELPPYYWDAYGKTNSDDDRSTIQQRGTAVGDYDITNYNHAYEGMSGYNGYPAVFGTNKTYANLVPNDGNFILTSSHNIINVTKFDTSYGLLYSHIKLDGKLTSRNIDYPSYKIKVTGLGENFGLHYSYLESSSDTTVKGFEINNDGIYIIPKSFASDGSLTSNSDWIGFIFTGTAPESCNVTIEVLPEYENGLVYDGVDDYSENTSIPAFTDYTYIIKYEDFNNPNTGSCIQRKGSIKAGGGAFVQDHIYRGTKYQYNFGISSNIHKDDSIAFCTKTNYNGTAIPSGNNTDDTGFTIGKFDGYRKMVFYKEMLYPRTVNMLTINMIKNMMAEDGIIDIQGKLFTDKFTGDFNLDFNKDFLIGN